VAVLRWSAVAALSLAYYTVSAMTLLFGGILAWSGIQGVPDPSSGIWRLVGGVALVASGVLVFAYFPRLVKRLTGREVLASPYGGFGAGGGGSC
jgi:hypothetical protein